MIKKHLKAIYFAAFALKRERKAFVAAKKHLKRGLYYRPFGQNVFCKRDAKIFLPKNFLHCHINFKNKGQHLFLEFGTGYGKAVILTGDTAYGYYYKKEGYEWAKRNFELFYKDFNYPCITGVSFCDACMRVTMNRERGEVYTDSYHDEIILTKLLEFLENAKTKKDKNGNVLFLQHADACRQNIIWDDKENFTFIDLDNIEYYPPLLDVFHYFAGSGYDIGDVVSFLDTRKDLLKAICLKADIDTDGNMVDALFAGYVSHYKKLGANYEDMRFLNSDNTKQFPKTHEMLVEIGL